MIGLDFRRRYKQKVNAFYLQTQAIGEIKIMWEFENMFIFKCFDVSNDQI